MAEWAASIGEYCRIVPGAFTPVLAKHSKSFSLIDCISVGVDRMQRNFGPMRDVMLDQNRRLAVKANHSTTGTKRAASLVDLLFQIGTLTR